MEGVEPVRIITAARVKELTTNLCRDDIDDDAAEVIAAMADDVLMSIVSWSANIAKKRGSVEVEDCDVRKACEDEWGISLENLEASANR